MSMGRDERTTFAFHAVLIFLMLSEFCCVIVMENTVLVQVLKVCNTVKPSLVFHTGGMFVILINVYIYI